MFIPPKRPDHEKPLDQNGPRPLTLELPVPEFPPIETNEEAKPEKSERGVWTIDI